VNPAVVFGEGGTGGGTGGVVVTDCVTVPVEVVLDECDEQEAVSAQADNTATADNRRTAAT
jgi:hypothetical protein